MNLQQLKYVHALCEEGAFVSAAARCAVTQPTLSNAVAQLETELGHKIFNRTTRSVGLTPFGEALLPIVRQVLAGLAQIGELAEQRRRGVSGAIRVGFSPVVGIERAVGALHCFTKNHPDVTMVYWEENLDDLCTLLRNQQLDLVLAPVDLNSPDLEDCVYGLIQRDPLMFVPNQLREHDWSGRAAVDLIELGEVEFVLVPDACGLTRVTKRYFKDENITLHRYPGEASSYRVVGEWAALGLGSGILPLSKVESGLDARLALPIQCRGQPVTIDYYAFGRPNTIPKELFAELWQSLMEAHGGESPVPLPAVDLPAG